ncbi:MAG: hypothetical protein ABNH26_13765 [Celeribacter sp.]|jgi:hypothetical protein
MSDPATNTEIEDVLSSIRRLVAQTRMPASSGAGAATGTAPTDTGASDGGSGVASERWSHANAPEGVSDDRSNLPQGSDTTAPQAADGDAPMVEEAGHVYAPLTCTRSLAERIAASNRKPPVASETNTAVPSHGSAPALVLTPSFRILPELVPDPAEDDPEPPTSAAPIPLNLSRPDRVDEDAVEQTATHTPASAPDQPSQSDRDAIAAAISRRLSELEAGVDEHPQDWEPDGSEVIRDAPPVQWDDAEAIDVEDAFDIELARVSERVTSRVSAYVARRSGLVPAAPDAADAQQGSTGEADPQQTVGGAAHDPLTFHTTRTPAARPEAEAAHEAATSETDRTSVEETGSATPAPSADEPVADPSSDADTFGAIAANLDVDPGAQWSGALAAEADALAAAAVADLERATDADLAEAALADGFDDDTDRDEYEHEPKQDDPKSGDPAVGDAKGADDNAQPADHGSAAAQMPALAGSMELTIDDGDLREIVGDILRDELRGVLGEQITRNVRLLVRREIQRILAGREFD